MGYFHQLWARSWSDTWELVVESPARTLFIAFCILVVSAFLTFWWKGWSDAKELLWGTGIGVLSTGIIFVFTFAFHFFVLSPKALVEDANAQLQTEQTARLKAEAAKEESSKELEIAQQRATQLSDALAMGKLPPDPDEWTPLSEEQISEWITRLKPYGKKNVSVQWFSSDTDARAFYKSLKKVGEKLEWNMGGWEPMDSVQPGLTVESRADDPAALAILKLLKDYSGEETKWMPANYDQGVINIKVGDKITKPH